MEILSLGDDRSESPTMALNSVGMRPRLWTNRESFQLRRMEGLMRDIFIMAFLLLAVIFGPGLINYIGGLL